METKNLAIRPVRRPQPDLDTYRRGVRLPIGADSKLFGGWGVRF
jgi:hypothetical protein